MTELSAVHSIKKLVEACHGDIRMAGETLDDVAELNTNAQRDVKSILTTLSSNVDSLVVCKDLTIQSSTRLSAISALLTEALKVWFLF